MKSDISRKQAPIAAYSEEPIKQYPEPGEGKGFVGDRESPGRVSGEMISAIRRQRGTSGVEYWRTASSVLSTPRYAKGGSFQNLFFPSLDMSGLNSGNIGRITRERSNGTDSKPGVPECSRSRTVTDMTFPGVRNRAKEHSRYQPVEAKKVLVTDLTCLELGDSIDTSKSQKLAYFYQLYQTKFRYTDYFEHDVERPEGEMPLKPINGNGPDLNRVQQFHPRKPMKLNPGMRTMSLPSMNPHKRASQDSIRVPIHGHTVAVRGHPSRRHDSNGFYVDLFSRKHPLKPTLGEGLITHGRTESDLAIKGTVYSIKNNHSTRTHRQVSVTDVPQVHSSRTVRSASIPRAHLRKKDSSLERTRKRSVHFSVSNEVYEYAPTDPVKT